MAILFPILAVILVILGVTSYLQYIRGWDLSFLNWVNNWGPDIANYIRIGAVIVAVLLLMAGSRKKTYLYISKPK